MVRMWQRTDSSGIINCKSLRVSFWKGLYIAYNVHQFPVAAMRNYRKPNDLKECDLLLYGSGGPKSKMIFMELKVTVLAGRAPPGHFEGECFSLSISSPGVHLRSVAPCPFLCLQNASLQSLLASLRAFSSDSCFPLMRTVRITMGPPG